MKKTGTLDRAYFEELYQANSDPWDFATSPYEAAKYARTLKALSQERATSALEVGCSIGVLTKQLSRCCDRLLATDISPTALDQARRRCAEIASVTFRLVDSAAASFDGDEFDLILLSEVVYYWGDEDVAAAALAMRSSLKEGGRILLVHWLGETDYPKSADEAVEQLAMNLEGLYTVEDAERTPDFRLDLWRWNGAPSKPT